MSRLLLLRHAKAAWAGPGMQDFDRGLDRTGRRDADAMGMVMAARGYVPDRVVCSAARRASETWEGVSKRLPIPDENIVLTESLYLADGAGYLAVIRQSSEADTLLLIGHNPTIEDVAFALGREGDRAAMRSLSTGFPTAGLAVLGFDGPLTAAAPSTGRLEAFLSPADLRSGAVSHD